MLSTLFASSIFALSIGRTLAGGVQWAGVNIAGFDFGCGTDGTCVASSVDPPLVGSGGGADGPAQMQGFVTNDKMNIFRLPVGWQYLVPSPGAPLNAANFATYDKLMQACLKTGAHCIIDIHNYARWNGGIIGTAGGPSNEDFASLWSQLAGKYATEGSVIMGLMNEPHDIQDMTSWAASCQAAVTAIRQAGATTQTILLPGNDYTAAGAMISSGSAAALAKVTNPDGSITGLIFDMHNYFDSDGSGTHTECVSNKIDSALSLPLDWMRANKRQALVSELGGGGSAPSCLTYICEALDFLNENSDVYLGWIDWASGSFDSTYILYAGPPDSPLMKQCIAGKFNGGSGAGSPSPTLAPGPASSVAQASSTVGITRPSGGPGPVSNGTVLSAPTAVGTGKPCNGSSSKTSRRRKKERAGGWSGPLHGSPMAKKMARREV